jgi:tRNA (cytidine/uridine-2'-O-)-methyltransferase
MNKPHVRKVELPFIWPDPPLNIALVEPKIPQNTGNIARLCAGTRSRLHLVDPLGFRITDKDLRRAGLDYWNEVDVERHDDLPAFERTLRPERTFLFSTAGTRSHFDAQYQMGDTLVFGSETEGLPDAMLEAYPGQIYQIPIVTDHVRSLNLATSVSIVLYEALRQINCAE